ARLDRARPAPAAVAPALGWLRLDVAPDSAEVFIDGGFVGTAAALNARRLLPLGAGRHRIEARAEADTPLAFDILIVANETTTYRRALERELPGAPAAGAVQAAATVMYVIPGCYAGNVPPRASRLPAGCDIARVQILR